VDLGHRAKLLFGLSAETATSDRRGVAEVARGKFVLPNQAAVGGGTSVRRLVLELLSIMPACRPPPTHNSKLYVTIVTPTLRVDEYVREDGSNPYRRWFESLPAPAAAKVAAAVYRLALGNTSKVKWFAGIGERIIDWGPGYRIYLARNGPSIILLLGGGAKRSQRADVERAVALRAEHKARATAARRATGRSGA
jgi:putative addiction module killer protein